MNFFLFGVGILTILLKPLRAEYLQINAAGCGVSGGPKLIYNGTSASPAQFPWMVQLAIYTTKGQFRCGGTIITRRHVLTAGHCIKIGTLQVYRVDVLYGHNDPLLAKRVGVVKAMVHPDYTGGPVPNDIAVLLVKYPFSYSTTVWPICLPMKKMKITNKKVIAAGWGETSPGSNSAPYLQYTTLKIMPQNICQLIFGTYKPESMLCARNDGTTVCRGDSGGPLLLEFSKGRFVQVGVTSSVRAFNISGVIYCQEYGSAYTSVEAFMPWIKQNIGRQSAYNYIMPYQPPRYQDEVSIPYTFSSVDAAYEEPLDYLL